MKDIIVTSSYNIEGFKITEYIKFISVEVVIGTGIFSEFKAQISDFFGSRSGAFQAKLAKIKALAIKELKEKAAEIKGNAVIGVDLDYINFTQNIIGLVISGTVVSLKKDIQNYEIIETNDEINLVNVDSPLYIKSKKIIKYLINNKIKNLFVQFELLNPKMLKIQAIKFTLKLSTFFDEAIELQDPTKIIANIATQEKQIIKFDIDTQNPEVISHVDIIFEKIAFDNQNIWISKGNIIEPNIANDDLIFYQNYFGFDAYCYPSENNDYWTCICGNVNNKNDTSCSNCFRKKVDIFVDKDTIINGNKNLQVKRNVRLIGKKVWNRKEKMHGHVKKVIEENKIVVQNRFGIYTWEIEDCDIKK